MPVQIGRSAITGVLVLGGLSLHLPVAAQETSALAPDRVFVNLGRSSRDATVRGLGVRWEGAWRSPGLGGEFSGALDLSLMQWSAVSQGRRGFWQVSLVPLLRWRPRAGDSPWFLEAGIGGSYHHRNYVVEDVRMGSRWNFHDVIGFGRNFGSDGRYEWSLRAVHVSNAGIRKPNPGEDLVILRGSFAF